MSGTIERRIEMSWAMKMFMFWLVAMIFGVGSACLGRYLDINKEEDKEVE